MAIGSRLRMLTDKITAEAALIYNLYGIELQPKWFPVFHQLSESESTITEIARQIGHSHPSVSKIVAEMVRNGIVTEKKDKADGRKNVVALSPKGRRMAKKILDQYQDVNEAIAEIMNSTRNDLWKAIEEWEFLLEQKSLLRRVQEQKKHRESSDVRIVDYTPEFARAFRELNEEWISAYFKMEEADYKSLDDPEGYIIKKGGYILVALYKGEPAGVCALIKMDDPEYDYEMAKMAVTKAARGKNIGFLLGQAIIKRAREINASSIYLESNTILEPAINLYHKLGFRKVVGHSTPYERCNIQMALKL